MQKELIEQWEQNKHKLEDYFRITPQEDFADYEEIVTKIFKIVLTESGKYCAGFDVDDITTLRGDSRSGTMVFIIPVDTYSRDVEDYLITDTYYGSCTSCDIIERVRDSGNYYGIPNEEQVRQYMYLALQLVQKMRWLEDTE